MIEPPSKPIEQPGELSRVMREWPKAVLKKAPDEMKRKIVAGVATRERVERYQLVHAGVVFRGYWSIRVSKEAAENLLEHGELEQTKDYWRLK